MIALKKCGMLALTCLISLSLASCATKWKITGAMNDSRAGHTATKLADGSVLVIGGFTKATATATATLLASTERYNPATGVWTPMASMNVARAWHTATMLANGRILVTGGYGRGSEFYPIDTTELYDPAANTWTTAKSMHLKRGRHMAILLPDSRVLVIGSGPNEPVDHQRSVESYDPVSNSWTQMSQSKLAHTLGSASLQLDGTIIVAGGAEITSPSQNPGSISLITYSERYTPASDTWSEIALLNESPQAQTATVINDGTILLLGGRDTGQTYKSALRYQPKLSNGTDYQSNLWPRTSDMITARSDHQATLLFDGTVLVTGGAFGCVDIGPSQGCQGSLTAVESFAPSPNDNVSGTWTAQDEMFNDRCNHTATVVSVSQNDCRLMVAGGLTWNPGRKQLTLNTAELFPVPCPDFKKTQPTPRH